MILREDQVSRRLANVKFAAENGYGYGRLSYIWSVSTPAAFDWVRKYAPPEHQAKLAENGRNILVRKRSCCVTHERLELIALCRASGWSDRRIARAIGISAQNLSRWLARHAPHGLDEALMDFRDDEAEAA